jgi:hypothetical protein
VFSISTYSLVLAEVAPEEMEGLELWPPVAAAEPVAHRASLLRCRLQHSLRPSLLWSVPVVLVVPPKQRSTQTAMPVQPAETPPLAQMLYIRQPVVLLAAVAPTPVPSRQAVSVADCLAR